MHRPLYTLSLRRNVFLRVFLQRLLVFFVVIA